MLVACRLAGLSALVGHYSGLGSVGYEAERSRERQAPSTSTISTSAAPSRSARAA